MRKASERYNKECLVPTIKFGGGSVMCLGAISSKIGFRFADTVNQMLNVASSWNRTNILVDKIWRSPRQG